MKNITITLTFVTILLSIILIGCSTEIMDTDTDGDGWSDIQEENAGTNYSEPDTDGDGIWDARDDNPLDPNIPAFTQTPDGQSWSPNNPGHRIIVTSPIGGEQWFVGDIATISWISRDIPQDALVKIQITDQTGNFRSGLIGETTNTGIFFWMVTEEFIGTAQRINIQIPFSDSISWGADSPGDVIISVK